jgi:outer membrane receptor protein involved in Fe transport
MGRQTSKLLFALLFVFGVLQALPNDAVAQRSNLVGTVTDATTGDGLPGATVVIDGTEQGAITDADGRYIIVGINPGSYTVRFSFVGYSTLAIEGIRITSDRTATLDATLSEEVVQGEEIFVEAQRPVVDQNQTTSRSLVTSEEIGRLPVSSLQDVIARTSNSYDGFIRGSRRFETKTVIEGIDVSDAFYSLAAGSAYEGSNYSNANRAGEQSASVFSLNPDAVEEVTVNSGATEAQYDAGSGGVVAVTLAEGRGRIGGSISARIAPSISRPGPDSLDFYVDGDQYAADRANVADPLKQALYTWTADKYAAGEDPEMDIRFNVGGSITDAWTFNLSGQYFSTGGYKPNYSQQRMSANLKSTYAISPKTQLTIIGLFEDRGLWGGWNNTDYMEFWRFYLEGVAQNDAGSYVGSIRLRQVLSQTSYLTVQAYQTYDQQRYGYVDDDGDGFQEIGEDGDFLDFTDPAVVEKYIAISGARDEANNPKMFVDIVTDNFSETQINLPNGTRYRLARPAPFSEDRTSKATGVKADYANQINMNHFIQAGAEMKMRSFEYRMVNGLPGAGAILNDAEEPFRLSDWSRSPTEISLYASDRMQYAGLIVNVGVRVNMIDRDMQEIANYYYPFEQVTETFEGKDVLRNNIVRGDDIPMDILVNPSIGVSHPIGSTASMYFSFSRASQLMPYSQLYQYYDGIHTTSRFFTMVDPAMDPITSTNYELGVQWEFSPGWGADINAYSRSIDNYGGANFVAFNTTPEGQSAITGWDRYTYRTNNGYADARGVELVLRRAPLQLTEDVTLGLTASYTYSSVESSSNTGQNTTDYRYDAETGDTQLPFENAKDFQNFAINVTGGSTITGGFDRRHRGILRAVSNLPYGINLGLNATLESGFQYGKAIGADPRDRELLTAPSNFQADLRLQKGFDFGGLGLDVYVDVTNLTNKMNVVAYENYTPSGPAIFQETGVPGSRLIRDDGVALYGMPRTVYFGTRLRF